ncbi:hypothetical protein BC936DRAFT_137333 [Jimgerdemannia flammicorona]|uniref:Uncharacterized protein n=1 Tax=Jimgerdemannia flammicorona TaxID=994334 RepID=A0A433CXL8_9FUNG|nr:hypothetical protein BC936DRAFT_137333 [Jimgerdemannia flammicorona]
MPANIDSTRPHFLADPQSLMARPSYAADAIITAARTGDDYFTSSQIRSSSPIGEASGTDDDMDLEESSNIPRITVNTITSLTPPGFSRTTFPSGSPLISPLHSHRPISRPISPLHPPSTPLSPLLSPTSSRPMSPYPPHESHLLDTRVAKVAHVLALEPYDLEVVLRTLFPSLQGWTEKSMSGKITSLVATPILLVLRLTLPVVDDEGLQPDPYDYEDEDGETAGLLARCGRGRGRAREDWVVPVADSVAAGICARVRGDSAGKDLRFTLRFCFHCLSRRVRRLHCDRVGATRRRPGHAITVADYAAAASAAFLQVGQLCWVRHINHMDLYHRERSRWSFAGSSDY